MQHLADVNSTFPQNVDVELMRSKFITMNEKANSFVCKRIIQPSIINNIINSTFDNRDVDETNGENLLNNEKRNIWDWLNSDGEDTW